MVPGVSFKAKPFHGLVPRQSSAFLFISPFITLYLGTILGSGLVVLLRELRFFSLLCVICRLIPPYLLLLSPHLRLDSTPLLFLFYGSPEPFLSIYTPLLQFGLINPSPLSLFPLFSTFLLNSSKFFSPSPSVVFRPFLTCDRTPPLLFSMFFVLFPFFIPVDPPFFHCKINIDSPPRLSRRLIFFSLS